MSLVTVSVVFALAAADSAIAQSDIGADRATAQQALQAAHPGLTWRRSLLLDVNCDGVRDEIFTAQDATRYYVAAVIGTRGTTRASVVEFRLSGSSQDSFCGRPEPLNPESQDIDFREALGEPPEGFRRSTRCQGLQLMAGECDSFHLYWNHTSGQLDWWRL